MFTMKGKERDREGDKGEGILKRKREQVGWKEVMKGKQSDREGGKGEEVRRKKSGWGGRLKGNGKVAGENEKRKRRGMERRK